MWLTLTSNSSSTLGNGVFSASNLRVLIRTVVMAWGLGPIMCRVLAASMWSSVWMEVCHWLIWSSGRQLGSWGSETMGGGVEGQLSSEFSGDVSSGIKSGCESTTREDDWMGGWEGPACCDTAQEDDGIGGWDGLGLWTWMCWWGQGLTMTGICCLRVWAGCMGIYW